ncbi:hypothetical protein ASG88_15525 [Nocardioides sp. Soil777]|uniref:glycerophosphodiester phosphodiesterase n=1 Tax=Nocardioides sp. Soil777 TaxID=1736409 RepID=UPI000702BE76|nr:glycerophosphodiester phosphodiesterase [Nocardioides sp. Soil777]KRE99136.1 hypothetical protein ASG88_15525 [Nocardioides sp. Soil777]
MDTAHRSIARRLAVRTALLVALVTVVPWPASGGATPGASPAAPAVTSAGCLRDRVLVLGHRGTGPGTRTIGGQAFSENSLAAFEQALRVGADGVEADYWPTADGRIATHHDPTLDRMTPGRGRLGSTPWARVSLARLPSGDRVPTFGAVAAALAPYDAHRQQEVKHGAAFSNGQLRRMVATDLSASDPGRVLYTSSEPRTLARIDAIDPRVRVGLIARDPTSRPVIEALPAWLDAVLVDLRAVDADWVGHAEEVGLQVSARGVDTVADLHRAADLGVTRVLTDRPEVVGRAC